MAILLRRITRLALAAGALCLTFALPSAPQQTPGGGAPASPVLSALQQELDRSMATLGKADPKAYFINYTVTGSRRAEVQGSNGALLQSLENHSRWLEVQVRVGDYKLDNTHKVGDGRPGESSPGTPAPIDDDPAVLRRAVWLETDRQYRNASEAFIKIQTSKDIKAESSEGQAAPDFSREQPHTYTGAQESFTLDRKPWEEKVRVYSRAFRASSKILNSIVTYSALAQNQYEVNSEGTKLQFGEIRYRLELYIQGKAPDGMDIERYYNFDWTDPSKQPGDEAELEDLVAAPLVEPFAGPAMLTGRAAAVFFHEVFGHRAEGHRQKDINEGQTFARSVGEQIFPDFLSIYDDPTKKDLGSSVLLGYYPFDDEGVPTQRVTLVEKGVLKGFEMSRMPLVDFPRSNGHGRRQLGFSPVSRQGNLLVQSSRTVSNAELRKKLIDLIKEKGKPFGLLIDDIAGGFTITGRGQPQAFQVLPLVVYKVFSDGRPDELVRGADIVGTPLVSLTKIVATGDTPEVFNGYCGAESGSVPVAAASPAILISEMEIQKKQTSLDKPPTLPPPAHDPAAKTGSGNTGGNRP
jgi:TldD protein